MPAAVKNQGKASAKKSTATKADAKAVKPKAANGTAPKRDLKFGKSKADSPVATAWSAFDEVVTKNPEAPRKECIEAAVEAGVNPATARTQYQVWLHAEVEA